MPFSEEYEEITNSDNSDLNELKKTGLRVVQYRRINRMDHFDSENAPPVTEKEKKDKMLQRCASMSQCILEALCVAAGMTASTKEYLSVESEALMTALIYVLRVFCIKFYFTLNCSIRLFIIIGQGQRKGR